MLTTKTPKATVGGLSPSKGYTLQIFELTGSGNILLARREFVSKCPGRACVQKRLGAHGAWMGFCGKGCVGSPQASIPPAGRWGPDIPSHLSAVEDLKSNSVSRSSQRPLGATLEPTPSLVGSPDLEPPGALVPSQDPPTLGGAKSGDGMCLGTGGSLQCLTVSTWPGSPPSVCPHTPALKLGCPLLTLLTLWDRSSAGNVLGPQCLVTLPRLPSGTPQPECGW